MNFKPENLKNVDIDKNGCLLNQDQFSSGKMDDVSANEKLLINNGNTKKGTVNNVFKRPQPLIAHKLVDGTHKAVFVQTDALPTKFTKGKFFRKKKRIEC